MYDRKKHEFAPTDLRRILRSIELAERTVTFKDFIVIFEAYMMAYQLMLSYLYKLPLRANSKEITTVLRSLANEFSKLLKFYFRIIPGVVLSIVMNLMGTFLPKPKEKEEENGEE